MSGTIMLDDDRWTVAGWLYRFVLEDLGEAVHDPQSRPVLDEADALGVLDLDEFPPADRPAVRQALGEPLVTRFRQNIKADYDPTRAEELLRELGAIASRLN